MMQWLNWTVAKADAETDDEAAKTPSYYRYIPAVVNSILIIVFGLIYKRLSDFLVLNENHRYTADFENSTINKAYMFAFVNTYISNFVAIIYNQNFASLTINLTIVMVFKQLFINSIEFFYERYTVSKKLRKVDELFVDRIEMAKLAEDQVHLADLEMHKEIEKQLMMTPSAKSLTPFYNEAFMQIGFIAFFATAFPFAPLFSFFTNLLEIEIKLQHIGSFGRRN